MSTWARRTVHEPNLQPQAWHRFDAFDPPGRGGSRLGYYSNGGIGLGGFS